MEPAFDQDVIVGLRALDDPGENAFFQEIMSAYLDTCRSTRAGLRIAVDASDLGEVRRLAHGLKGASLNVGSRPLAECCRSLEDASRQGDRDAVLAGHEAFAAIVDRVVAEAGRMMASPESR